MSSKSHLSSLENLLTLAITIARRIFTFPDIVLSDFIAIESEMRIKVK